MSLPSSMRQIRFNGIGGPEVIGVETAPLPQPGKGQVLVKVLAAGINRPDCLQRAGGYPPPPGVSDIPGLEISGTILALGAEVPAEALGRKICALTISGGYAGYALAEYALCLPVPQGLSMIEAAGLPETFFTVFDNVFTRGRLKTGESILIHGGSSGIGSTAIQLAREAGARVFATAGSAEKCVFCARLGAIAINYLEQDFVSEIKRLTDGRGVDVILDMVGGSYLSRNLSILALEGRLVQIAFLESSKAEVDFRPVMLKRLTLTGSTLRPRSVALKAEIARKLETEIWPWLDSKRVKPMIDRVFPLDQAREAHELMESSAHCGKIILDMQAE
jgi:NADPH:quinone reductase